jgi:type I restriction enzyme S subunit
LGVEGTFFASEHAIVVTAFPQTDIRWLTYVLGEMHLNQYSESSAQPGLSVAKLLNLDLAVPSSKDEQRAIAGALSDVDALIGALDQLIAKKRDLKQAAMQQLLTGQKRLPGFHGEWEVKRFGEVAMPRKERVDPRRSAVQEFCVELEHIEPGTGKLLGSTITGENSSLKSVFREGDVLFGKLRAYLRKFWLADRPGVCSTEIWVFVTNARLATASYLFQLIKMDRFIDAASTAYGTHMPRSDWNVVKNYELRLPPLPEQTTIAGVLSDTDAELAALEQQRDKTRALKQGMMQELLIGKTRLL